MNPPLFLPPGRRDEFHRLLDQRDPDALALRDALDDPENDDGPLGLELLHVCRAWLEGCPLEGERAAGRLLERATLTRSDLGRGGELLALSLALDFGEGLWGEGTRRRLVDRLAEYTRSFTRIGTGNPHIITNNWYLITHGACLLGCLAAHGEEGSDGRVDLSALEFWALGRVRAFCGLFGDHGLYHEGTGYLHYTCSMLMPVARALLNRRGIDLTAEFPALKRFLPSILLATAALDTPSMLDWNDSGRGCGSLNPYVPALTLCEPAERGALREVLCRLIGPASRRKLGCEYHGLPLAVALFPFDTPAADPATVLPTHVLDTRQGLGFWRSGWGHGEETVFGFYARSIHASPGHSHDDAGSIRLIAAGRTWICGGGQGRDKAIWQSVLTHVDESQRPKPRPFAYLFTRRMDAVSGCVGLEMRQVLQAYAERYLSWRADLPLPFALAVLDTIDEHQSPPRAWTWNLSFPNDLHANLDSDGRGFRLDDPARGSLHCRFLLDAPDEIRLETMPASRRTYAGGNVVEYPGDGFAACRFRDRARLAILAAIFITPPGTPAPAPRWEGRDVLLADGTRWADPFAGAILPSAVPGRHRPNFQLAPGGEC